MKTQITWSITGGALTLLLLGNPAQTLAAPSNPAPPGPPPAAEPAPELKTKKAFVFGGGSPLDFILAMDRHFRTRLHEILSVPYALAHAQVPKMRLTTENPAEPLTL